MIQDRPGDGVPGYPDFEVLMDGSFDPDTETPTIRRFGRPGRTPQAYNQQITESEQAELLGQSYQ